MAEWIEIRVSGTKKGVVGSPLAMAEWIEMFCHMILKKGGAVSASDGGVD